MVEKKLDMAFKPLTANECLSRLNSGQRDSKLEEPLCVDITYPIQWRESKIDLSELAKLREEGWTTEELARHFQRKTPTIRGYISDITKSLKG